MIFTRNKIYENNFEIKRNSTFITKVTEMKILGMIFDQKLTWKKHIEKLKRECNEKMKILKILAAKNWGADMIVLTNTYKSIMMAKLDYGSIIYNSSKDVS